MMGNENDFQYVLQDFSNVYIGARLTYEKMTTMDDTPQRLSSAVFQYIYRDEKQNSRICDHLMEMDEKEMAFLIFKQLKAQVKIVRPEVKVDKKGNESISYKTETVNVTDFVQGKAAVKREEISADAISEVTFRKLNLVALSV